MLLQQLNHIALVVDQVDDGDVTVLVAVGFDHLLSLLVALVDVLSQVVAKP